MTLVYELIFLVLVPASLFDLWQYRVPNALCFAALVISLIGHLDRISAGGISFWLAGIIIPFSVSFIFYVCHVFGASDSKLISVIGAFLGFRAALRILVYSIFVGAIMALFKMIWRKNMFRRFRYLFQFIKSDKKTRNKNPYYDSFLYCHIHRCLMGDILGKVPFYANGRERKKEDSDERNDNTFVFFAGRLWKAAAPLFDKEKE